MLKRIFIKNYAIIDRLELDFGSGLSILTGETGAGKSIIVDAIQIAIGGRASSEMVRYGESKAVIECIFDSTDELKHVLDDFDDIGDELILRREISSKGSSRCFVNDSPTTVAKLKEIGEYLVDFHGQHEHQSLLKTETHIDLIDAYSDISAELEEYANAIADLRKLINQLNETLARKESLLAKKDIIKSQIDEIKKVNPKISEDGTIEAELKRAENAEFLASLSGEICSMMVDSEGSCYSSFAKTQKIIEKLAEFEPSFEEFSKEIDSIIIFIKEISTFSKDFLHSIDFNPNRIDQLRSRFNELKRLTKKYGSIEQTLETYEKNQEDLRLIEQFDDTTDLLKKDIIAQSKKLGAIAEKLSETRKAAAKRFSSEIVSKLYDLGIENAAFDVNFKSIGAESADDIFKQPNAIISRGVFRAFPNGIDKCEFLIATNKGGELNSLTETASGGEISRVMLSIKSVMSRKDKIPVMIFDEIDTGISGRIALKVGFSMKKLARNHQIIAITHLPQIAALGDMNISVEKLQTNGGTAARARVISSEEKPMEIAKLISGETVSDISIKNAIELINAEEVYE